jgi:cytochrome c551
MNVGSGESLMRRYSVVLAAAAAIAMSATGCGSQHILTQDQVKFPQAVQVYQNGCITCHGDNLQGKLGPNLQHVGSKLTKAQIEHIIEHGSGPMPAYALSGDAILTKVQIQSLATWLESKK